MASDLIHSSARVLEFDSLRELLRGYASSPLGRKRIAALVPSTDSGWIEGQQQLAEEVREFRRVGGRFDFSALIEIGLLVEKSRIAGAALGVRAGRASRQARLLRVAHVELATPRPARAGDWHA